MVRSYSFAWIVGSLLLLALAAPLQAVITPSGDVHPSDHSWWHNGGNISTNVHIGNTAVGSVAVNLGSDLSSYSGTIGSWSGSAGVVTVDGSGSTWTASGGIGVGDGGQGTLNITTGGSVSASYGYIGNGPNSIGVVTVDGSGSTWTASLDVGGGGQGTLNITNGGAVSNTSYSSVCIGTSSGSTGVVTVADSGSTWTNISYLYVGGGYYSSGGTGELTVSGGGSVEVGETLKIWSTGTVQGDSTITANVIINAGTVKPGISPGTLSVNGDYTQEAGGLLEIEIGGLSAGSQHDQMAITGTASLAGTLDLSLIGEYVPDFYDEFEILTAGTVSGTFDTITGVAADPDLYLAVVYNADNVTVVAAIPGDANLEGNVNDSDLSFLLSNFGTGSGGTWAKGDFNGDGAVDDSDLSILLTNFGATSASLDVPEPATILLLGFGGLALLRRRRK